MVDDNLKMNGNDPKYLALRRRLDNFGYTQTLHPDSIELVSRLLKDQEQVLTEIDNLKRKSKDNSNNQQNSTLIPVLEQQIDRLQAEKKTLQRQLQESRNGGSQQADERTLRLQANVNDLRVKLEEAFQNFSQQRQELEGEIEQLTFTKTQLVGQNQRLKSLSSSSVGKLEEENHELTLLIDRKNKEIKQLEDAASKGRIKMQVLEKSVEELRNTKDTREDPSRNDSSRITAILKQELAETEGRYRQTKTQLEQAQDESDGLRRQLRRAREELASLRMDESKNRSLDSISKAGLEKYEAKLEETLQQLSSSNQEVRKLKEQIIDGENVQQRLNAKIKELTTKLKLLTDQNNDLQSQIQLISGKLTTNVKRVRQLEAISVSYEKQLKEALDNAKSAGIERIHSQLEEERVKAEQLRKEVVLREREYKLLEEEVRILREQGEQRTIQRDKAQLENKKLLTIINEGSKNTQLLQMQKEELMKENRQLKTGKQQITSSDQAAKSELFLLKQKNQAYQVQLQELRGAIHSSQASIAQLQGEILRLQRQLTQSEEKNKQVFQDNRQMVAQLKVLEQRKNELHQKVRELQEREQLKNDTSTVARKEFDNLLAENQQLQAQLTRKDQALRIIDGQRDELQEVLDQETEARARLQEELQTVRRQARRVGKEVDQREYGLNDLKARLSRTESERDDLDKQLHRQCEENLELKDRLATTEVSCRELQNQVNNLAISNKENERECERGRLRVAELDRKLRQKVKDFEEERERATALMISSNQLLGDMERERAEIVRLQGFMRELEEANNSNYHHLVQKDAQLEHYLREVEELHRQQAQLRLEVQSYQRQLENLTQDYEMAKEELRQISGDREALRAERNWKKDLAGQSEDWRARQEQRYVQLQQQFDRKRHEVSQLRDKNKQLQSLLSQQRAKSFQMSRQLEVGVATPSRTILVESRVESYHSQNQNNSNVHSRARSQSQSVQSAMEKIMRLQEQYDKTNPKIRK